MTQGIFIGGREFVNSMLINLRTANKIKSPLREIQNHLTTRTSHTMVIILSLQVGGLVRNENPRRLAAGGDETLPRH